MESFLHWLPKVLAILFILFVAMFSLDVFDGNLGFWETILALFMNNIPAFVLIIILVFAWRRPMVGAIGFLLMDLLYFVWTWVARPEQLSWFYINPIFLIAVLIGVLFWVSHKRSKFYWENRRELPKKV
jgi:hypothetical protein